MIRHPSVRATIGLLLFGLSGCETVLGLSPTDPTLTEAGGQAGAAGQAGSLGTAGNPVTSSGAGTSGSSAGEAGSGS